MPHQQLNEVQQRIDMKNKELYRWTITKSGDGEVYLAPTPDGYWVTIDDHLEVISEKEELIALLKRQINDLLCRVYYEE